jgi:alanine-glyoxylate transaminase/serine-glyoxylate transaminase/serine-pyruvate transaminase
MPGEKGADAYRDAVLDKFNMSLGSGLGILKDRVFRIGHLGDFNDLTLVGALGGVEMGFALTGVPYTPGGVMEALNYLTVN